MFLSWEACEENNIVEEYLHCFANSKVFSTEFSLFSKNLVSASLKKFIFWRTDEMSLDFPSQDIIGL